MKKIFVLLFALIIVSSCQYVDDITDRTKDIVGEDFIDKAKETIDKVKTYAYDSGAYDKLKQFEQDIRENTVVKLPTSDEAVEITKNKISDAIEKANELKTKFTSEYANSASSEQVKEIERTVTIDISSGNSQSEFTLSKDLATAEVDNIIVKAGIVEIGFTPNMLQQEFDRLNSIHVIILNSGKNNIISFKDENGNEVKFLNNVTISINVNNITNNSVVYNVKDKVKELIGGKAEDNRLVFKSKEGGDYSVETNEVEYVDIDEQDAQTQEAIEYLGSRGIFDISDVIEELAFNPGGTLLRADAVAMITKTLYKYDEDNEAYFTDVAKGDWYYTAVASGAAESIIVGYPDNSFKPHNAITKQELLVVAANTLISDRKFILPEDNQVYLGDFEEEIADWAKPYAAMCIRDGIVEQDRIKNGRGEINRAQAALILYNLFIRL